MRPESRDTSALSVSKRAELLLEMLVYEQARLWYTIHPFANFDLDVAVNCHVVDFVLCYDLVWDVP